jgi:hypothetical protein
MLVMTAAIIRRNEDGSDIKERKNKKLDRIAGIMIVKRKSSNFFFIKYIKSFIDVYFLTALIQKPNVVVFLTTECQQMPTFVPHEYGVCGLIVWEKGYCWRCKQSYVYYFKFNIIPTLENRNGCLKFGQLNS